MGQYEEKCETLFRILDKLTKENTAVAFSGGVDSSLLLKLACLRAKKQGTYVYAISAHTELHPSGDLEIAKRVAEESGAAFTVLKLQELKEADIVNNPVDRCYRCKKLLFKEIKRKAEELGAKVLIEGTNLDDTKVYRPGLKAIEELGIKSPLKDAGLTKKEIRKLAVAYDISVADRPSTPCLATRFPYGAVLSLEKMKKVEQGEAFLRELGLYNVRLRVHGETARIEVDEKDMPKLLESRKEVVEFLKGLGYWYITLDMEGFRSGSMDIGIDNKA